MCFSCEILKLIYVWDWNGYEIELCLKWLKWSWKLKLNCGVENIFGRVGLAQSDPKLTWFPNFKFFWSGQARAWPFAIPSTACHCPLSEDRNIETSNPKLINLHLRQCNHRKIPCRLLASPPKMTATATAEKPPSRKPRGLWCSLELQSASSKL